MDIKTLSDKKLDLREKITPSAFELFVILPWSDNISFSSPTSLLAMLLVKSLSSCVVVGDDIYLQSSWGFSEFLLSKKLHSSCLLTWSSLQSGNKLHFWCLRLIWEFSCRRSTEFDEFEFESSVVEFVIEDRLFLLLEWKMKRYYFYNDWIFLTLAKMV